MFSDYQRNRFYNDDFFGANPRDHSSDGFFRGKHHRDFERRLSRERRERERYERELYEERLRERVLAEQEREFRARRRRSRPQPHYDPDEEYHGDDDDYDLIRGRDGNLYYVRRPIFEGLSNIVDSSRLHGQNPAEGDDDISTSSSSSSSIESDTTDSTDDESAIDADDDTEAATPEPIVSTHKPRKRFSFFPRFFKSKKTAVPKTTQEPPTAEPAKPAPERRATTATIVAVEDASDSEWESEFDAPRRNRRPSPGEWMEPVESCSE